MKYLKVHPYTVFVYLSKFIFLLIIPVLQVIFFKHFDFFNITKQFGFNILFSIIIIVYAILRYKSEGYALYGKSLHIKKGLIFRKRKNISVDKIDSITLQKSFIPGNLFDVCRFFADIPSLTKVTDTAVYINYKRALRIIGKLTGSVRRVCVYKAKSIKILFMATLWSNSITGFLILMPFTQNVGQILGDKFASQVYESINLTEYLIYVGLPPAAAALTNIILVCWIFSIIVQLNRYLRFSVDKGDNLIFIKRGFLNRITFITAYESINAITFKQSIYMMLVKLYSTYIHTISTEKTKGDKSLLISPEKRKTMIETLGIILPDLNLKFKDGVKPYKFSIRSYLYFPIFILSLDIIPITFLFYTDEYKSIIYLYMVFSSLFILLWFVFRIIAFFKSELSINEQSIKAVTFSKLTVSENYIPLNKLQKITIRQSVFQKFVGNCHVYIYTFSENMLHFTVKHLPLKKVQHLLDERGILAQIK